MNEDIVPRVTFTDPELAHVGLTEDAGARRAGCRSACCAGPITRTTAPRPKRKTAGHIKVVTDRRGQDSRRHHRGRGAPAS